MEKREQSSLSLGGVSTCGKRGNWMRGMLDGKRGLVGGRRGDAFATGFWVILIGVLVFALILAFFTGDGPVDLGSGLKSVFGSIRSGTVSFGEWLFPSEGGWHDFIVGLRGGDDYVKEVLPYEDKNLFELFEGRESVDEGIFANLKNSPMGVLLSEGRIGVVLNLIAKKTTSGVAGAFGIGDLGFASWSFYFGKFVYLFGVGAIAGFLFIHFSLRFLLNKEFIKTKFSSNYIMLISRFTDVDIDDNDDNFLEWLWGILGDFRENIATGFRFGLIYAIIFLIPGIRYIFELITFATFANLFASVGIAMVFIMRILLFVVFLTLIVVVPGLIISWWEFKEKQEVKKTMVRMAAGAKTLELMGKTFERR